MQAHLAPVLLLATLAPSTLSACSAEEQTSSPIVLSEEMMLRPGEAPPSPSLVMPDVVDLQAATQSALTPADVRTSELEGMESGGAGPEEDGRKGPKGVAAEYYSCMKKALGTVERAECISDEENRQDARLNDSYQKLLELLERDRKRNLIETQREWLVLREKDATFEASLFENTQIENISGAEREVFYTAERADLIQEWLDITKEN